MGVDNLDTSHGATSAKEAYSVACQRKIGLVFFARRKDEISTIN